MPSRMDQFALVAMSSALRSAEAPEANGREFYIDLSWWQPILIVAALLLTWRLAVIWSLFGKQPSEDASAGMSRPPSKHRWILWLPPLLWAGFIFWLSGQSEPPKPGPDFEFKAKVGHYVLYTLLSGLLASALVWAHGIQLCRAIMWTVIAGVLYGVTDEFHQAFVPLRTSLIADCATDALGAIFGAVIFYYYESRRSTKKDR